MKIRPATHEKLGAVIVGEGFKITSSGVLSVDEKFFEQDIYVEFTRERLEEIFEKSKRRRR